MSDKPMTDYEKELTAQFDASFDLVTKFMDEYRDQLDMRFYLEVRASKNYKLTYRAEFVPTKGHPRAEQRRGFGEVRGKDELDAVKKAIKRARKEIKWQQANPPLTEAKRELARRETR